MEPDEFLYLETHSHWKAMSHPLRLMIVRLLRESPLTNEELARRIGVQSGKLYFHTKMLLDAGLIRMIEVGGKPHRRKLYRAVAMHFQTRPTGELDLPHSINTMVELFKTTSREYPDLFAEPETVTDFRLLLLPKRKALELRQKIEGLFQSALESQGDDAEPVHMALTVLFHRLPAPFPTDRSEEPI
jgi:DNA-binding transcriptional ArsR family regulator